MVAVDKLIKFIEAFGIDIFLCLTSEDDDDDDE